VNEEEKLSEKDALDLHELKGRDIYFSKTKFEDIKDISDITLKALAEMRFTVATEV